MANREIYFTARGEENYDALKFGLGSMRGVISMDVDAGGGVRVSYDDVYVNETQLASCVNPLGYVCDTRKNGRTAASESRQALF